MCLIFRQKDPYKLQPNFDNYVISDYNQGEEELEESFPYSIENAQTVSTDYEEEDESLPSAVKRSGSLVHDIQI